MIQLLDHGYLKLIEAWGSDEAIVEAARMSTQKGFLGWGLRCPMCGAPVHQSITTDHPGVLQCPGCGWLGTDLDAKPGDEKLLRTLYKNKHSTPFEFGGLVIEVQAPIFVFRE